MVQSNRRELMIRLCNEIREDASRLADTDCVLLRTQLEDIIIQSAALKLAAARLLNSLNTPA